MVREDKNSSDFARLHVCCNPGQFLTCGHIRKLTWPDERFFKNSQWSNGPPKNRPYLPFTQKEG